MKAKLLFTIPLYLSALYLELQTKRFYLTRAEILKIFDSDGNGKLSMAERFTMRKKIKKRNLQKFDLEAKLESGKHLKNISRDSLKDTNKEEICQSSSDIRSLIDN